MYLQSLFSRIFNKVASKDHRVRDCYGRNGWRWHKILQGFAPGSRSDSESILELKELLANITLMDNRDEAGWRWNLTEIFTVKSIYNFLQDSGVHERRFI